MGPDQTATSCGLQVACEKRTGRDRGLASPTDACKHGGYGCADDTHRSDGSASRRLLADERASVGSVDDEDRDGAVRRHVRGD